MHTQFLDLATPNNGEALLLVPVLQRNKLYAPQPHAARRWRTPTSFLSCGIAVNIVSKYCQVDMEQPSLNYLG